MSNTISPLVHALAGSIGSALSLWLMYPLERVRIEMQTGIDKNENDDENDDSFQDAIMTESNDKQKEVSNSSSRSSDESSSSFDMIDPRNSNSNDDDDDDDDFSSDISSDYNGDDIFSKKTDAISFVSHSRTKTNMPSTEQEKESQCNPSHQTDISHSKSHPSSSSSKSNLTVWKCLLHLHRKKQLYNGAIPMVTTLAVSNFVFFYTLHYIKRVFLRHAKNNIRKSSSSHQLLFASTMAGIINVLCTNPLWVANLSIIKDKKRQHTNLGKMILHIYHESGLKSLWSGTYASLLLVSNPVIQYFVYELGKKYLMNHYNIPKKKHEFTNSSTSRQQQLLLLKPSSLDPVNAFLLGASSKALSTVTTYPLQLAQVIMRSPKRKRYDKGTWQCLNNLYKEEGLSSLYVGMNAKLLQTVLTSAFTFLTYEQILNIVTKVMTTSIS